MAIWGPKRKPENEKMWDELEEMVYFSPKPQLDSATSKTRAILAKTRSLLGFKIHDYIKFSEWHSGD